ncbi:hypothetical protein [Phormidesmis sp. 146-33]
MSDRTVDQTGRGGVLLATAFGSTLFQLTQGFALIRLDTFANSSIQATVWDRLLSLKVSFFRQYAIGDREKALAAGCDDYDTKSIELSRLLSKLEGCLIQPGF